MKYTRTRTLVSAIALLAAILVSCSDDGVDPSVNCASSELQACSSLAGSSGEQTCSEDGLSWSECSCSTDVSDVSPTEESSDNVMKPDTADNEPAGECSAITPSADSCKDCCDCMDKTCAERTECRQTCDALSEQHWASRADRAPYDAPSELGSSGDYGTCTEEASEQLCKSCCCDANLTCGDRRYCRDACNQTP
jgi:hypothetical protein